MTTRTSIYVEGFSHKNPIPAACRIGNTLYSGSIQGTDPATGKYGTTIDEQSMLMFAHVKRIVQAAGGSTANVIKMTVWMRDRAQRESVNREWLKMFPDPQSRPARHAMQAALEGEKLLECDFIAVLGQAD
ncbi:MAG: RidA family protein [Betaproteobacteria bacterium]|nr:RidA family protein [Betaproteobacteria bacterium]